MGATGPSGGFDIHNFFNKAPPSPYPPPQYSSHPPYTPNQYPPASNFPTNPASFSNMSGQNFQYSAPPPQQGSAPVYHHYMHYPQEHALRPPSYSSPPFNQQLQPQFPPPGPLSSLQHSNPPHSSLPMSSIQQGSGGPSPASTPPLDGARLMALLTTHSVGEASPNEEGSLPSLSGPQQTSTDRPRSAHGSGPEVSVPPPAISPALPTAPPVNLAPSTVSARVSSGKQPKGRHLRGEHVVYDVDVRKPGEAQPQLEVSPITVYGSDPVLVVGRQIAVNKRYICYGLRAGTIRILNINTALRALLRGHTQRVTDMAFLAEDIHLLASASADGRIFVRKIMEGPEDGKVLITEQIVLAVQIVGDWESCHPRLCWNLQMPDVLVVAIGKFVLTIEVSKARQAAPPGGFVADQPIVCRVESPIEGVNVVGAHDDTVTDLSVPSFTSSRLASASEDGTMRIWGDKMRSPLLSIVPHGGEAVGAVAFLSAPHRPDHHVLLTTGPLNRELKLWAPTSSPDESPSKSGTGMWRSIQTLEFQSSSSEGKYESAFFNQLVVASRASLILLANAKKNAIYAVHVEFGLNPTAARMNYLAEFSVTMPILSLTVTDETVTEAGEGKVQVYCVQTQAIQQYGLDVSQCLPPLEEPSSELPSTPDKRLVLPTAHDVPRLALGENGIPNLMDMVSTVAAAVSNVSISGPSVTVPPRPVVVSSAFGSPVEVGHREVSDMHHGEKNISVDFAKLMQGTPMKEHSSDSGISAPAPTPIIQSKSDSPPQMVSRPEAAQGASTTRPPTGPQHARQSRSRSPTKTSDIYIPVGTGSAKQKPEDNFESRVEASPFITPLNVSALDKAHSSSSSTSLEESLDRQDKDASSDTGSAKSTGLSHQGGHHGPHLITPSELMNLAAGSKHSETYGASNAGAGQEPILKDGRIDDTKGGLDVEGLNTTDATLVTEKEVVESKVVVIESEPAGKDVLVSSLLASLDGGQVGTNMEYNEKESSIHHESQPTSGFLPDMYSVEEILQVEEGEILEERERLLSVSADDINEQLRDLSLREGMAGIPSIPTQVSAIAKGRKNKNKTNVGGVGPGPIPPPQIPAMTTPGGMPEGESSYNMNPIPTPTPTPTPAPSPLDPGLLAQVASMQDSLNQLVTMQKELQKQMTVMVAVPVAKEGKRMEGALGQRMEKVLKAHVDAMWARLAEENAKRERLERERVQQVTTLLTNFVSKDMPVALERGFKKEFAAIGPVVAQAVLPPLQKAVSTTVAESFQKGVTEKMLPQLEKSVGAKLEGTVTRQIQTQFQTIGRQALQDALRSCFESTVLPAFERSCQSMFAQIETHFQRGMAEYTQHAQEELVSSHSALASTLQETVASATSLADSLKGELADGQKKLVTLAENASANAARAPPVNKQINGGLPDKVLSLQRLEESLDPTIELTRLVKERKLEDAFNKALSLSDVAVVSWLCMQMDQMNLFAQVPLPLSQGVLLSLVQQLGCDLGKDTARKLSWIREAALALNPNDPLLAPHMRPFLEQLYQNLHNQVQITTVPGEQANLRLVIHVVNSLLTACK